MARATRVPRAWGQPCCALLLQILHSPKAALQLRKLRSRKGQGAPTGTARQGHVPAEQPWDRGDTVAQGGQAWNPLLGLTERTELEWKLLHPTSQSLGAARGEIRWAILSANRVLCRALGNVKAPGGDRTLRPPPMVTTVLLPLVTPAVIISDPFIC